MAEDSAALPRFGRVAGRSFGWLVIVIAGLVAAYCTAGLIGGAIPANLGRQAPAAGVRIYVIDNGIHTDLVLPKVAAGVDWRDLAGDGDIADPRYAAYDHLAFGWGSREFYENTPYWSDLKVSTLVHAALGSSDTVLHIAHIPAPAPGNDVRSVVMSAAEYHRLADYIRTTFAIDADGRAASVHGYGGYDAFYAAHGHYNAFHTCNAWVGAALRAAGMRMGRWTPFPGTVTIWL